MKDDKGIKMCTEPGTPRKEGDHSSLDLFLATTKVLQEMYGDRAADAGVLNEITLLLGEVEVLYQKLEPMN